MTALRFRLAVALLFAASSAFHSEALARDESKSADTRAQAAPKPALGALSTEPKSAFESVPGAESTATPQDTASNSASAKSPSASPPQASAPSATAETPYEFSHGHTGTRKSDLWIPLVSVILPGFGQYMQEDNTGYAYSAVWLGGILLAVQGEKEIRRDSTLNANASPTQSIKNSSERKDILGGLAVQGAGLLSAYSAFRSAVPLYQERDGKYLFLSDNESLGDMFLAPLQFTLLSRPSTYIPLGTLVGLIGYGVFAERSRHRDANWLFSWDDVPFSSALAYNAGLTEEASFRGYLLPLGYQYTGQSFWIANGLQAALFGALHYSHDNPIPWPQALLGCYYGYLTRKNNWTLSESIFNHFWWDATLFMGSYLALRKAEFQTGVSIPVRF